MQVLFFHQGQKTTCRLFDLSALILFLPPELGSRVQGALRGVSGGQPHAVRPSSGLQGVRTRRGALTAVQPPRPLPRTGAPGTPAGRPSPRGLQLRNGEEGRDSSVPALAPQMEFLISEIHEKKIEGTHKQKQQRSQACEPPLSPVCLTLQ